MFGICYYSFPEDQVLAATGVKEMTPPHFKRLRYIGITSVLFSASMKSSTQLMHNLSKVKSHICQCIVHFSFEAKTKPKSKSKHVIRKKKSVGCNH
jgi:hypothetical protein